MKRHDKSTSFYIGWDVGGWNCDHNAKSRDAIVILDEKRSIVGEPWRGNLRKDINQACTTREWLTALFVLCSAQLPGGYKSITLAIDTPLGFSEEFRTLITAGKIPGEIGESSTNPYLFRKTERYLFEHGGKPLSPIKDMIGSQATKGMHVLAKFAPRVERCGVWTESRGFRAIEAYPSASRNSSVVKTLLKGHRSLGNDDLNDARICAVIAYLFACDRTKLIGPDKNIPEKEGWIWVPADVL